MSMIPIFEISDADLTPRLRMPPMFHRSYFSPWRHYLRVEHTFDNYVGDTVTEEGDAFKVVLDVHNFLHDEIQVKTKNGEILVEGRHREKAEGEGKITRHFVKKYKLAPDHRAEDVRATFTNERMLVILAPKRRAPVQGERIVPIVSTVRETAVSGPAPRPICWENLGAQSQPTTSKEKNSSSKTEKKNL